MIKYNLLLTLNIYQNIMGSHSVLSVLLFKISFFCIC